MGQLNYLRAGIRPRIREVMPPPIDGNGRLYKPVALRTRAASRSQLSAVQQVATMRELAAGSRCSSTNVTPGKSSDEKRRAMFQRVREKVRKDDRAARSSLTYRLVGKQRTTQWGAVHSGSFLQCPAGNSALVSSG